MDRNDGRRPRRDLGRPPLTARPDTDEKRFNVLSVIVVAIFLLGFTTPGRSSPVEAKVLWTTKTAPPTPYEPISATRSNPRQSCQPSPRSAIDRRDIVRGPQVHVVYVVAADEKDRQFDKRGTIHCSVSAFNRWFEESSGGLRWRVDRFRAAKAVFADVSFLRSKLKGETLSNPEMVDEELRRNGFDDPDKTYLSYVDVDAGTLCGAASYPVIGEHGRSAVVYLRGDPHCHGDEFGAPGDPLWVEATALHELAHAEGTVPIGAPHGCAVLELVPTHVCTQGVVLTEAAGIELDPERVDLMFPFVTEPLSGLVLDRDNDDYFDHPFPYRDLKSSPYIEEGDRRGQ